MAEIEDLGFITSETSADINDMRVAVSSIRRELKAILDDDVVQVLKQVDLVLKAARDISDILSDSGKISGESSKFNISSAQSVADLLGIINKSKGLL